jgi:uncharacterized membrane protein YcaP (DUF421 family)
MIDWSWITTTGTALLMVLLSGLGIYAALLLLTRLTGLRSFSKMSSFDFAITVALGSVIASTLLTKDPSLLVGAFGLAVLYAIQYAVSKARRLTAAVERLVDNVPLVVMAGERVLTDHLDKARMTEDDLKSKLRMAGVTHPGQVLAVVFETTGDVSVVKRTDEVDPWIFEGVRGAGEIPVPSVDESGAV